MTTFSATIKKFGAQGEKTGWYYLEIPAEIASLIKPGYKRSFRVRGKLDSYKIEQVSLLPMGGGSFIIPLNAAIRKGLRKNTGAIVKLALSEDPRELEICPELIECLKDEPKAKENFTRLPPSHQRYYSKWILSAKTEATKVKRIVKTVEAMRKGMTYGEMMKEQ